MSLIGKNDLLIKAKMIMNETRDGANTATRVGQMLLDFINGVDKSIPQAPKGGYPRTIFESMPNVQFNEHTNYYEVWKKYGGLSDVTEQQMIRIFLASILANNSECYLEGFSTRAVIPLGELASPTNYKKAIFYWCPDLEFIAMTTDYRGMKSITGVINFAGCAKLHTVISPVSPINDIDHNVFRECAALRHIPINIKTDLYLGESPHLQFYTLLYISKFPANNGNPISVGLHTNVYSKVKGMATDSVYAETGYSREEWVKVDSVAKSKGVSFVEC